MNYKWLHMKLARMRKGTTSLGAWACEVRCWRWLFGNKMPSSPTVLVAALVKVAILVRIRCDFKELANVLLVLPPILVFELGPCTVRWRGVMSRVVQCLCKYSQRSGRLRFACARKHSSRASSSFGRGLCVCEREMERECTLTFDNARWARGEAAGEADGQEGLPAARRAMQQEA